MSDQTQGRTDFDGNDPIVGEDGLPVREVGAWSKNKHYFLERYIDAFTTSMKDKPRWSGLGYVDLFAGPGMCRIRNSREQIDGSPLIALNAPRESKSFNAFFFADKSPDALNAIEKRFTARSAHAKPHVYVGDCNETIDKIVKDMDRHALYLAFIDPTGLDVHFDTIRKLTSMRRVDLIISIMDRLDLVRNIRAYYYPRKSLNLDTFLGEGVDWRQEFDSLPNQDAKHVTDLFLDLYRRQLRAIGYEHFGLPKRIAGAVPFYLLFFASRHKLGAELWDNISATEPNGQRPLF